MPSDSRADLQVILDTLREVPSDHPLRGWIVEADIERDDATIASIFEPSALPTLVATLADPSKPFGDEALLVAAAFRMFATVDWNLAEQRRLHISGRSGRWRFSEAGDARAHEAIDLYGKRVRLMALGDEFTGEQLRKFVKEVAGPSEAAIELLNWAGETADSHFTDREFYNAALMTDLQLSRFGAPERRAMHLARALLYYTGEVSFFTNESGKHRGGFTEDLGEFANRTRDFPWDDISHEDRAELLRLFENAITLSLHVAPFRSFEISRAIPFDGRIHANIAIAAVALTMMWLEPAVTLVPPALTKLAEYIGYPPVADDGKAHRRIDSGAIEVIASRLSQIDTTLREALMKPGNPVVVHVTTFTAAMLQLDRTLPDWQMPDSRAIVNAAEWLTAAMPSDLQAYTSVAGIGIHHAVDAGDIDSAMKLLASAHARLVLDGADEASELSGAGRILSAVDNNRSLVDGTMGDCVQRIFQMSTAPDRQGREFLVIAEGDEALDRLTSRAMSIDDTTTLSQVAELAATSNRDTPHLLAALTHFRQGRPLDAEFCVMRAAAALDRRERRASLGLDIVSPEEDLYATVAERLERLIEPPVEKLFGVVTSTPAAYVTSWQRAAQLQTADGQNLLDAFRQLVQRAQDHYVELGQDNSGRPTPGVPGPAEGRGGTPLFDW